MVTIGRRGLSTQGGLLKNNKVLWKIYMAMTKGVGVVKQEGRFIKFKGPDYEDNKIYLIDSYNGKLVEIA